LTSKTYGAKRDACDEHREERLNEEQARPTAGPPERDVEKRKAGQEDQHPGHGHAKGRMGRQVGSSQKNTRRRHEPTDQVVEDVGRIARSTNLTRPVGLVDDAYRV